MGIQYLNSFLKRNTNEHSIKKLKLNELYGKTIVIDTSIYLYRFLAEEALLDNMYTMLSLFKYYNIAPIFVFDGKAPQEKNKLLDKRKNDKVDAEVEYNKLKLILLDTDIGPKYDVMQEEMILLKKKFVRLKKEDILDVQKLMRAFGVTYLDADGEADALCAKLVIKKQAFACLSEDMDLFVYGCPRVLRYLSLLNETVVIYLLDKILIDLNMTQSEFKEICILSGTDYNYSANINTTLYKTINYFKLYKKAKTTDDFYKWIEKSSDYIANIFELYNIYNMFQLNEINLRNFKTNNLSKPINVSMIKEIMKPAGFIFIK
jgi:flap endonuclease-1